MTSDVFWAFLTYLPTQKSDVIYECSQRRLFFHLDFFFFFRATMSLTNFDQDHSRTSLDNCSNEVNSTVATPEEFVTKYGGKRVIKKILIANNGIAGT